MNNSKYKGKCTEKQVLLSVRFQVQRKEKQKIYLQMQIRITRKYKWHIMTCESF